VRVRVCVSVAFEASASTNCCDEHVMSCKRTPPYCGAPAVRPAAAEYTSGAVAAACGSGTAALLHCSDTSASSLGYWWSTVGADHMARHRRAHHAACRRRDRRLAAAVLLQRRSAAMPDRGSGCETVRSLPTASRRAGVRRMPRRRGTRCSAIAQCRPRHSTRSSVPPRRAAAGRRCGCVSVSDAEELCRLSGIGEPKFPACPSSACMLAASGNRDREETG
jgi:hypothetical protein